MADPSENLRRALVRFMDKLVGEERHAKLTFNELTLEMGKLKTKLNGFLVLDVEFAMKNKVGADLQLTEWMSHVFKFAEIGIAIGNREDLQIKVDNRKIDVNVIDKQIVRKMLSGLGNGRISLRTNLIQLRKFAEGLRNEGLTLTVSYKSVSVVTIGRDAKPTISHLITGTDAIEINNLLSLIELGL